MTLTVLFATTRKVVAFWLQKVAWNSGLWANVGHSVALGHLLYINCLLGFRSLLNELYKILRLRSG